MVPADVLDVPRTATTRVPTTVLWNVPGTGHHPISDAIEAGDRGRPQTRIDIVNPYISQPGDPGRLLAAAQRGVRVRLIAPGKPTPPYPAAAFRHQYERLMEAGVEILLHPEMAHAKVLRIDDRVLIGGCNLDDLSLFRNDELNFLFDDAAVAERRKPRSSTSSSRCPCRPSSRAARGPARGTPRWTGCPGSSNWTGASRPL